MEMLMAKMALGSAISASLIPFSAVQHTIDAKKRVETKAVPMALGTAEELLQPLGRAAGSAGNDGSCSGGIVRKKSGYMHFCNKLFAEAKQKDEATPDFKKCGELWRALSDAERDGYNSTGAASAERGGPDGECDEKEEGGAAGEQGTACGTSVLKGKQKSSGKGPPTKRRRVAVDAAAAMAAATTEERADVDGDEGDAVEREDWAHEAETASQVSYHAVHPSACAAHLSPAIMAALNRRLFGRKGTGVDVRSEDEAGGGDSSGGGPAVGGGGGGDGPSSSLGRKGAAASASAPSSAAESRVDSAPSSSKPMSKTNISEGMPKNHKPPAQARRLLPSTVARYGKDEKSARRAALAKSAQLKQKHGARLPALLRSASVVVAIQEAEELKAIAYVLEEATRPRKWRANSQAKLEAVLGAHAGGCMERESFGMLTALGRIKVHTRLKFPVELTYDPVEKSLKAAFAIYFSRTSGLEIEAASGRQDGGGDGSTRKRKHKSKKGR